MDATKLKGMVMIMTFSSSDIHERTIAPTDRDKEMFRVMGACGGLLRKHVSTLFYPEARTHGKLVVQSNCSHRMTDLCRAGYIRRIERYQLLSEGKKPYMYALTRKGAKVLAAYLGCEIEDLDWRQTDIRLHPESIEHLVLNIDVRIAVMKAVQDISGLELVKWYDELFLKSTHSKDKLRVILSSGKSQTASIIPDDYFLLRAPALDDPCKHFFVEIDRATETGLSSVEGRRTWERKITLYLEYFKRGGLYEQRYGTYKGRVLTVTTSETRLANLKRITEEVGGKQRFWFTTFHHVSHRTMLFQPIWQIAKAERGEGFVALFSEEEQERIKNSAWPAQVVE
jgi:hypothetical protein